MKLVSAQRIAERMGVTSDTVNRLALERKIPIVPGMARRHKRFDEDAIFNDLGATAPSAGGTSRSREVIEEEWLSPSRAAKRAGVPCKEVLRAIDEDRVRFFALPSGHRRVLFKDQDTFKQQISTGLSAEALADRKAQRLAQRLEGIHIARRVIGSVFGRELDVVRYRREAAEVHRKNRCNAEKFGQKFGVTRKVFLRELQRNTQKAVAKKYGLSPAQLQTLCRWWDIFLPQRPRGGHQGYCSRLEAQLNRDR